MNATPSTHRLLCVGLMLAGLTFACQPPPPAFGECNRDSDCELGLACVNTTCRAPLDSGADAGDMLPDAMLVDMSPPDFGPLVECEDVAIPAQEWRVDCGQACALEGFTHIAAGTFMMGSPPEERYRDESVVIENHETQHRVTLTRDFWLKTTEVTRAEWASLAGQLPEYVGGLSTKCVDPQCPARDVNWYEALAWSNALSRAEGLPACYTLSGCDEVEARGLRCESVMVNALDRNPLNCLGYRLPTEAEWEYAARAGTRTAWYSGADEAGVLDIAWTLENSDGVPQPVAQKLPNAWGLFDMSGNAMEWVWDASAPYRPADAVDPLGSGDANFKVLRGGMVEHSAPEARSATRRRALPLHGQWPGFRVARTVVVCGDAICGASESSTTCPADCPLDGFAIIPQGEAWTGSIDDEVGRETPASGAVWPETRRLVRPLQSIWAKRTEVTRAEWRSLSAAMGAAELPAADCDDCPVTGVNWYEALAWCNAKSEAEGVPPCYALTGCEGRPGEGMHCTDVEVLADDGVPMRCEGYRLPTEVEWEVAARAGADTRWPDGEPDPTGVAWFAENADAAQPVGGKTGNCWGLYDTAGNVHEWVWDEPSIYPTFPRPDPIVPPGAGAAERVVRGGAFDSTAAQPRSAARLEWSARADAASIGFRPVRTISAPVTMPRWTTGKPGPGGGWIFYDKGVRTDGWRYLEAAPGDSVREVAWGCQGARLGVTTQWIGAGLRNTATIIEGCPTSGIAARVADGYSRFNGRAYDDWFLPTLQAWAEMQTALVERDIGGFTDGFYWSSWGSHETGDINHAWIWRFDPIGPATWCKNCPAWVRPIRRF